MAKDPKKRSKGQQQPNTQELPLPIDSQTEKAVLGAIVLDSRAYYQAVSLGIGADDFAEPAHRRIFRAMAALLDKGQEVDPLTLGEYLKTTNELELVGGYTFLSDLTAAVYRPNLDNYATILKDKRIRRQVIAMGDRAIQQAYDMSEPPQLILEALSEDALILQGNASRQVAGPIKNYSAGLVEELEQIMLEGRELIGLPFGIPELDDFTTGMRASDVIVIGGFPGSGKTGFALTILLNNARAGTPGVIFSIEMRRKDLMQRILSQLSGISYNLIRRPHHMHRQDIVDLTHFRDEMNQLPLIIDDDPDLTAAEMEARARLYIAKYGARFIVVDYLQLLQTSANDDEYTRVSKATDMTRRLARTTEVPVIALSQLTRSEKKDINQWPNMMMLRSSGQIEQNANLILFTYHPFDEAKDLHSGEDCIIIGKQRAGTMGKVKATYDPRILRWEARVEQPKVQQAELALGKANGKAKKRSPKPAGAGEGLLRPEEEGTGQLADDF